MKKFNIKKSFYYDDPRRTFDCFKIDRAENGDWQVLIITEDGLEMNFLLPRGDGDSFRFSCSNEFFKNDSQPINDWSCLSG